MQPLVYLFLSFFKARDSTRKISISMPRDALPTWLVMAALLKRGFGIGEVKLNYPPPPDSRKEILEIDCSEMRLEDYLLTGTRYAEDDEEDAPRKTIPSGYTSLEQKTNRVWRLYFKELSRQTMTLQPWLRPLIRENYESRRDVQFLQSERADYAMLNACDGSGARKVRGLGRTAAFVVNQPEIWPGGPTYLGFFGMDGASTLAWAYLLSHRHSDLLFRPGFHMVELITAPIPERVPDLRWALDWQSEILLSVPPAELAPSAKHSGPKKLSGRENRDEFRA